ncbi:MAG: HNH endonuclease, partial [Eubacteriales bacterium]|nr:HNH endonuclease [Eubacteriales bacterium]
VFTRRNSDKNYTEPHHIVPLSASADFPNVDLDREQNVVSLCSNCHNILHYGADFESILKPLYEKRKDLLKAIGVEISYEELKKYY